MALRLTGPEMGRLSEAVRDAYGWDQLTRLVRFRLDKKVEDYAAPTNVQEMVFKVIDGANMEGWIAELIVAAIDSRPKDAPLRKFGQEVMLASRPERSGQALGGQELEAIVNAETAFANVDEWLADLGALTPCVCRVEISGNPRGTGFLLAKDIVMTNRHVLAKVIDGLVDRGEVRFRFDYRADREGLSVNAGHVYELAGAEWHLDSLPHSAADLVQDAPIPPTMDELDFALVRLEGAPGADPAGSNPEPGAPARGWISVPDVLKTIAPGQTALILQHPGGAPLKLATGAAQGTNANATRQRYATNTEAGSSGSPVFNFGLELCLLHHAGDPQYVDLAEYNQGIPLAKIVERLEAKGLRGELGR